MATTTILLKKEEGRGKREEGRRKREEGRKKKEEGRGKKGKVDTTQKTCRHHVDLEVLNP
ncbi:MAG: hypothetical protein F6K23_32465 [Okeania sp. SIO2C9]|uniref:hypothetical protein n=1 Tax=Okeania sp. SIO2C9 TaxID=2607791 RepID=UPI0013C2792F|nr:hypothetical protein [Okeania sp. SIO2C9]NEQ77308.1 hypothetical protein [Okeania sp. SIO2C9]